MADYVVEPSPAIAGRLRVPGDKSISHRAVMFGAIASGTTHVTGFLEGEDCLSTMKAVTQLGVRVQRPGPGEVTVEGVGLHGFRPPAGVLDMGNAGTAMRLFMGLLAAQPFDAELVGDASLMRRPMERVAQPLRTMGARIETQEGRPPVRIKGGARLHGIHYPMPVASAQVKSALLLAGLYAEGETTVVEPAVTRDHTERMLQSFGVEVRARGGVVEGVGVNPTRTGLLEMLALMGADLRLVNHRSAGAEPVADIEIRPARLHGVRVPERLVPLAIDEFPAFFVAAACAEGETLVTGAEELRVKESDRIAVMARGLDAVGVRNTVLPDGLRIEGGPIGGGRVDSHGDHRAHRDPRRCQRRDVVPGVRRPGARRGPAAARACLRPCSSAPRSSPSTGRAARAKAPSVASLPSGWAGTCSTVARFTG